MLVNKVSSIDHPLHQHVVIRVIMLRNRPLQQRFVALSGVHSEKYRVQQGGKVARPLHRPEQHLSPSNRFMQVTMCVGAAAGLPHDGNE